MSVFVHITDNTLPSEQLLEGCTESSVHPDSQFLLAHKRFIWIPEYLKMPCEYLWRCYSKCSERAASLETEHYCFLTTSSTSASRRQAQDDLEMRSLFAAEIDLVWTRTIFKCSWYRGGVVTGPSGSLIQNVALFILLLTATHCIWAFRKPTLSMKELGMFSTVCVSAARKPECVCVHILMPCWQDSSARLMGKLNCSKKHWLRSRVWPQETDLKVLSLQKATKLCLHLFARELLFLPLLLFCHTAY